VISTLKSLIQLIYPPHCLICFQVGEELCKRCLLNWQQPVKYRKNLNIPYFFTNYYNSDGMKIILAAKENGNQTARRLLACSIANSLTEAIDQLKLDTEISLVTIPSRFSAIRKRGRDHISELAVEVIAMFGGRGIKISHQNILHLTKQVKDQSNLNRSERIQNMNGAYLATYPESATSNLIIIDDLITTGASIHEAIRALSIINLRPVAIITACAVNAHL
jgi:predicted amidophosphoribosyltransferase